jgi:HAD superfamily hydrolase (TIGR01662 family)
MDIKFKYLLFDWDGCLVDTLPFWFEGMKKGLEYFNIETSDDIIKKGFQGWNIFSDLGVSSMKIFTEQVYNYVNRNLCNVEFYEGVIDTLKLLKQKGIKLAIVTSTEKEKVNAVLERYSMTNFFDCIIGRNDVKKQKPDTESILKAIEILKGEKSLTAIIGDSEVDVKAGQNAGISTIWFSSKRNQIYHNYVDEIKPKPNFIINDFREIVELNNKSTVGNKLGIKAQLSQEKRQ